MESEGRVCIIRANPGVKIVSRWDLFRAILTFVLRPIHSATAIRRLRGSDPLFPHSRATGPDVCMLAVGTVLRGSVPHWGHTAQVWIRILAFDALNRDTVRLRITPHDSTTYSQVWVERVDLEFALTAGVVEKAPRTIRCDACDGQMRLMEGMVCRDLVMLYACRECEEVKVI